MSHAESKPVTQRQAARIEPMGLLVDDLTEQNERPITRAERGSARLTYVPYRDTRGAPEIWTGSVS